MNKFITALIFTDKKGVKLSPISYYRIKKSDLKKYNFSKNEINTLISYNLIPLNYDKPLIMELLKKGLLDFYRVSSISVENRFQFSKEELEEIMKCERFWAGPRTGMQSEPLHVLNRRTLILHQDYLSLELLEKLNWDGRMTKTILSHRKRLIKKAKQLKDADLELYLECM